MGYRDRIREQVCARGIEALLHFTPLPNLRRIFESGLLSRDHVQEQGGFAYTSIDARLDGNNSAISLSVSAYNHRMLTSKIRASGRSDWVILAIQPSVLWTHDCRFNCRNAATREMQGRRGFTGGPWAFSEMFDYTPPPSFAGHSYRIDTGIPECLTTRSDAEVQVLNPIDPDLILGAWVDDSRFAEEVQGELNRLSGYERDVLVHPFQPRFANGYDAWG